MTLHHVNAFAATPFGGNPAAVCVMPTAPSVEFMRHVARDMNLSETAFVVPRADGEFDLRWFTPMVEIELCGHATLASAKVLWEANHVAHARTIAFHTMGGRLLAKREDDETITLDFPAHLPIETEPQPGMIGALGVTPLHVATDGVKWLVEVATEAEVWGAAPDMEHLIRMGDEGVIITAPAGDIAKSEVGDDVDFVSRYFAPQSGVPEDPATGSAHCVLGPWWASHFGRDELTAYQLSARRGLLQVRVEGDRVHLSGRAYIIAEGRLTVDAE